MINYVKFIRPVSIGATEHEMWSAKQAVTSAYHGKISCEEKEDKRGLLVCYRAGDKEGDLAQDIFVPWANVAQVTHSVERVIAIPDKGKEQKR